jgi:hypothetical protein
MPLVRDHRSGGPGQCSGVTRKFTRKSLSLSAKSMSFDRCRFSIMQYFMPAGRKTNRTLPASYCLAHDVIVMTAAPGL